MAYAVCAFFGFCYWLGGRRPVRLVEGSRGWAAREWRATSFASGLAIVALLLSPPVDAWFRERFFLRTAQLVTLVMLAAPLIVLGAPWPRYARLLGRSARGASLGSRWAAIVAFTGFNGALVAAHIPLVYRTMEGPGLVRELGQLALAGLGVFFWAQVIAQPPGRCSLSHMERMAYLVLSSVLVRLVGLVLGFAPAPFYDVPLFDQQMGAGVLIVPGVFTDLIVLTVCLYIWLAQDERKQGQGSDTGGHRMPVAVPVSRNEYG